MPFPSEVLCVAGSRLLTECCALDACIDQALAAWGLKPDDVRQLIHGACPLGGVDLMAPFWAWAHKPKLRIEVKPYPPSEPRARAFHARNRQMAQAATCAVVVLWWPPEVADPRALLTRNPPAPKHNRGSRAMWRELERAGVERRCAFAVDEARRLRRRIG